MIILLSAAGLLFLWFLAPFNDDADRRRIAEQRPGDVGQLTSNLKGCLIRDAILIALALLLCAIGLGSLQ